eukprot:GFYU01013470.1.p2 GENE.GFYU01013470.1~~GFYU01013470.1.p2  ORF type:complete len:101 (-),score=9.90 GFYU01013470.1:26-328(-)
MPRGKVWFLVAILIFPNRPQSGKYKNKASCLEEIVSQQVSTPGSRKYLVFQAEDSPRDTEHGPNRHANWMCCEENVACLLHRRKRDYARNEGGAETGSVV